MNLRENEMKLKYICFENLEAWETAFFDEAWPAWNKTDLEKDSPEDVFGFLDKLAADPAGNEGSEKVYSLAIDRGEESSDDPLDHKPLKFRKDQIFRWVFEEVMGYYVQEWREYDLDRIVTAAWQQGGSLFDLICDNFCVYEHYFAKVPGDLSDQEAAEAAFNSPDGVREVACRRDRLPGDEILKVRRLQDENGWMTTYAELWSERT